MDDFNPGNLDWRSRDVCDGERCGGRYNIPGFPSGYHCVPVLSVFNSHFIDTKTKFRDIKRLLMSDAVSLEPQVSHLSFILCCLFSLDYA